MSSIPLLNLRVVVPKKLGFHMFGKGSGHDEGAPTLGHLLVIDCDKSMAENFGRCTKSCTVQHRRPEQSMEVRDVLADEVNKFRVRPGVQ